MRVPSSMQAPSAHGCRVTVLAAAIVNACCALPALAQESERPQSVEFQSGVFPGSPRIDLSRFNHGNVVLPGTYSADTTVNGQPSGTLQVRFEDVAGQSTLCVDRALLERFGVDLARMDEELLANGEIAAADDSAGCRGIEGWIAGASAQFDSGELTLNVQIPQIFMSRRPRDFVPVEQLDAGETVGLLGYSANLYETRVNGAAAQRTFVGLRAGINAGGWLLRHQGALTWSDQEGHTYQSSSTYAQRDIDSLQSQLVVGQLYTRGDLFGSVRLQGAELATDDRMLPQSMTGFAPVVRGVAETNALVRILQRGVVLRELTVAPGPFEVDDLYAIGYGGDLQVVVREADGRERSFEVPYSGSTRLLRPGYSRYAVSAGRADPVNHDYQPYVIQGQVQRGLSNAVTGYAGALKSEHYLAAQIGAAVNTPVGALSLDLTQARLDLAGDDLDGQSVQLRYTKQLPRSGTNFTLGAYRYSTQGYVDINQALRLKAQDQGQNGSRSVDRFRSRFEANINQTLGARGGTLYASASSQDYWNRNDSTLSYTLGYSNRYRDIGYSLSAQRSRQLLTGRTDNEVSLTVSMPLGPSPRAPTLNSTVRRDRHGDLGGTVNVSGRAGANDEFNYGLNASHNSSGSSAGGNLQYKGRIATVAGSVSTGNGYRSTSLDANGGMVFHAGGITAGPVLGQTMALVHAPGAEGALLSNGDGARVDKRGFALAANLQPYRFNTVELDPRGLDEDVLLKTTTTVTAPRDGAVVKLDFETDTARSVLIRARQADGATLPFAAGVYDEHGNEVGNVGQGSRLQLRSDEENGLVTVRWGNDADQQCQVSYQLPPRVAGRARGPEVIDQAVCHRAPWVAGGRTDGNRVSGLGPKPAGAGAGAGLGTTRVQAPALP